MTWIWWIGTAAVALLFVGFVYETCVYIYENGARKKFRRD